MIHFSDMRKGLAINLILILVLAAGCTGRNGGGKGSSNLQPEIPVKLF